MKKYIDKTAVVAEIARLQAITMDEDGNFYTAKAQAEYNVLCMLDSFIDSLEVKEVDLEKEVNQYFEKTWPFEETDEHLITFARHFFELGLKAKGE